VGDDLRIKLDSGEMFIVDARNVEPEQPAESPGLEPWQQKQADWIDGHVKSPGLHREHVRQALEQGKPVPEDVLADYPDLAPRTAPTAETLDTIDPEKLKAELIREMTGESRQPSAVSDRSANKTKKGLTKPKVPPTQPAPTTSFDAKLKSWPRY
jgi:hypothetical protein